MGKLQSTCQSQWAGAFSFFFCPTRGETQVVGGKLGFFPWFIPSNQSKHRAPISGGKPKTEKNKSLKPQRAGEGRRKYRGEEHALYVFIPV